MPNRPEERAVMEPVEIVLPATSANLGPAFDAAAIALDISLAVRAEVSQAFRITAEGRDRATCGSLENNLLLETYCDVLSAAGKSAIPLALRLRNQIPIGKGCGSSAAARLAGVILAVHFGRLGWAPEDILQEAARREGHADNVAACWLGSLAVVQEGAACGNGHAASGRVPRALCAVRIDPVVRWPLLLVVPSESLGTERSRNVLPAQYSRCDAALNLQAAMMLMVAFTRGRSDLLRFALQDRMHEPYRSALCPLLQPLRSLTGEHGILAAVLSGSGPSVLLILDLQAAVPEARSAVCKCLTEAGLGGELILTGIGNQGASTYLTQLRGEPRGRV